MARIKYGSLVSDISGSIGSATFQKSLYGNTLRNKPLPRNSRTNAQFYIRGNMKILHEAWRNLTDAQRKQWNQFIAYSSAKIQRDRNVLMTGHALFIQYNMLRLLVGLALMTTPAYTPLVGIFDSLYVGKPDPTHLQLTMEDEFPGTQTFGVMKLSSPRNPSLAYNPAGLRYIRIVSQNEVNFDITALYTSIFGSIPAIGDTLHYSFRRFSTVSPIIQNPLTGIMQVLDLS